MEHALESIEAMRALRDLGVRLAVDDFGEGYAGLGYLRRCPIDGVKVDRLFVAGYEHAKLDKATVRSVLAFADAMGLEVTAEGIETEVQWSRMRQLGCHRGQGFWFAPPVLASDLPEMLATGKVCVPAMVGRVSRSPGAHGPRLAQGWPGLNVTASPRLTGSMGYWAGWKASGG